METKLMSPTQQKFTDRHPSTSTGLGGERAEELRCKKRHLRTLVVEEMRTSAVTLVVFAQTQNNKPPHSALQCRGICHTSEV
jgi:uncharacterized protein YbcC (UPF0753/DUF2309 family)